MLKILRIFIALLIGTLAFFLPIFLLGEQAIDLLKDKLYMLNALLMPLVGISVHIKNKADTLSSIQGLGSKDLRKITYHATSFNRRIWTLWFVYFLTISFSVIISVVPLSTIQIISSVGFCFSLFAISFLASISLYSIDQSVQILTIHLKAKATKNTEKENALKALNEDKELPSEYKEYLDKKLGAS